MSICDICNNEVKKTEKHDDTNYCYPCLKAHIDYCREMTD